MPDVEVEKPYDRIKVKSTNGQYHIHEILLVYDLESIKPNISFYLELAKEFLGINNAVEVEYARALREDEDEESE